MSDRQREIVEAAIRLISKGGIQGLTTKKLAAEIGFSEPALYRHFAGKQDIFLAILEYFKARQLEMHTLVSASEPSPLKALGKIIGQVFRTFSAHPVLISVVFAEGMFQNDPRLSRVVFFHPRGSARAILVVDYASPGENGNPPGCGQGALGAHHHRLHSDAHDPLAAVRLLFRPCEGRGEMLPDPSHTNEMKLRDGRGSKPEGGRIGQECISDGVLGHIGSRRFRS